MGLYINIFETPGFKPVKKKTPKSGFLIATQFIVDKSGVYFPGYFGVDGIKLIQFKNPEHAEAFVYFFSGDFDPKTEDLKIKRVNNYKFILNQIYISSEGETLITSDKSRDIKKLFLDEILNERVYAAVSEIATIPLVKLTAPQGTKIEDILIQKMLRLNESLVSNKRTYVAKSEGVVMLTRIKTMGQAKKAFGIRQFVLLGKVTFTAIKAMGFKSKVTGVKSISGDRYMDLVGDFLTRFPSSIPARILLDIFSKNHSKLAGLVVTLSEPKYRFVTSKMKSLPGILLKDKTEDQVILTFFMDLLTPFYDSLAISNESYAYTVKLSNKVEPFYTELYESFLDKRGGYDYIKDPEVLKRLQLIVKSFK